MRRGNSLQRLRGCSLWSLGAPNRLTMHYSVAYEYRLVNRIGVEDYSSVEIDFDPTYQRLYLHELSIKRQDRILDKLDKARISLLHREQALESLIFDGEQTLNLVVPDVRVGDILRVAYTLEGSNSIFDDLFETGPYISSTIRYLKS